MMLAFSFIAPQPGKCSLPQSLNIYPEVFFGVKKKG